MFIKKHSTFYLLAACSKDPGVQQRLNRFRERLRGLFKLGIQVNKNWDNYAYYKHLSLESQIK